MNDTTSHDATKPEHERVGTVPPDSTTSSKSSGKWINLPEGLSQWLSKRVQFSLPVWALTIAVVVLALLIFD